MRRVLSVILKGAVCIALTAPALAFSQDSIEELSRACDSGGGGHISPTVSRGEVKNEKSPGTKAIL
jgi:hypothetical protein